MGAPFNQEIVVEFPWVCEFLLPIHHYICSNYPADYQLAENGRVCVKPKPGQPLNWSLECQAAFKKLKHLFSAEPVLKHPDTDELFVIQADATDVAVGAVLLQKVQRGPCNSVPICPASFLRLRGNGLFGRRKPMWSDGLS